MSSDTITLLVKFLPTILAILIIFLCMLRGIMRGFRKSLILFLHYIIAIAIGLILYFQASKIVLSNELNGILSSLGPDFAEANSLYDVVGVLLNSYLPDFAGIVENQYMEQLIMAFAGLGISLVLGLVCLVIIPFIVRFILYLLYLLFYREGKIKKHLKAEGEEYHPHRFMGMFVGALRGVVCSLLTVSFVSSIYFVLSGGITHKEAEEVQILDLLNETVGFDVNALYAGIKESRSTGVGAIFEAIKINGTPVDLYYSDLFLSSTFTSYSIKDEDDKVAQTFAYLSSDEVIKGELAKLSVREELALLVGLIENIAETNAITIVDGEVQISYDILNQHLDTLVDDYIDGSTLLSDITPLAIIGVAQAIHEGKISTGEENIDDLFDEETVEAIRHINVVKDLSKILKISLKAVELLPVNEETGQFDFEAFSFINTYLEFDTEIVKEIFAEFGKIDTLTKVLFPVGVGFAVSSFEEDIEATGISATDLDFSNIDWGFELANLGNVYEKIVELELDVNTLFNTNVNGETGMSYQLEYLIELCSSEEKSPVFKQNLLDLVDTIFDSDLLSQVGLVYMKSMIAKVEFLHEDGTPSTLNDAFDLVKNNLEHYNKDHLRADLHELISSCLDVTSLLPLFIGNIEEIDLFAILYELKTDDIKSALVGTYNEETNNYEGGIYGLRLLSGDLDGVDGTDEGCSFATDVLIEAALKTYATQVLSNETIDSITSIKDANGHSIKLEPTDEDYDFNAWPTELAALVDAIKELQTVEGLKDIKFEEGQEITDLLPESITDSDLDVITAAASRSKLLSGVIQEKLVSSLESNEMIGYVVSDPTIEWMDTLDENGEVVKHGEINNLLKAFRIFSDDEKAISLDNTDSLINGLGLLLHEATEEDEANSEKADHLLYGLDYEEAICFAQSQVIMTVLSTEVSKFGAPEEGEESSSFQLIIPEDLDTNVNSEAWKNWSKDSSGDYKKGEFAKLVLVLYYAREYALANPTEPVALATEEAPVLTQNNLLDSVVYMEKDDKVTDSLVLYATVSDALMKEHNKNASSNGGEGSILYVPETAKYTEPEELRNNHNILIKNEEVQKLFVVIRNLEIPLINNDFSNIDLALLLKKLYRDDVRESICMSNIFAASTVNKVSETEEIVIPRSYQKIGPNNKLVTNIEHPVWYPSETVDWEDCELNKMLESISQLGIESKYETADGVVMEKLDFDVDKMLEELNSDEDGDGYTNLDVVYDSAVFRTTISNKIFEQEDIKYRSNALVEENFVVSESNCYNFAKKEIEDLITFLNETDIKLDDPDGFDTGTIFESLEDERVRQTITESNILNITVVDKLAVADGISIPATFKTNNVVDINKDAWYPAEDDLETTEDETVLWDECELGKLLASVVELDIEIVNGDPKFPEDETSLLKDLNGSSVTTPEADNLSKLDVVYSSDIIKQTIKEKLDENTEILKRDQAFVGGNRDNYYEKIEIELLVQFANNEGIDFNNISTSVVFDLLAKEDNRRIITESNILNITVVNKFDGVTDLEFPTDYLTTQDDPATLENEQKINVNAAKWYPADANWKNCELAKLLESVVELNITVDTNDNPVIPETDILLKSLNDENEDGKIKLDVVYESDIISKTINVKIKQDGICIRDEAYQLDENNQITDILNSDEILLLVDFVEFANIEIHEDENQVDAEHIFSILRSRTMIQTEDGLVTKGDVARKMIVTSNILNMTLVDKLALTEDLIFPKVYVLSEDDPSTTDINERVINEKLSIWYPADSSNWDDCELSRLLAGITELDMTASGNEITFSTNEIIDSLLEKTPSDELKLNVAYHSDVIAMTISNRVHNTASVTVPDLNNTIPTSGSNAKEHIIYDLTASRTIDDKIIHIEELDEMLYALLTPVADGGLGVSFASGFDIVNALSIDILVDNLNSEHSLLNSSILHYKVSQSLMEQKQATSDNDEGYSIVTQEYYINDTETTKIVYTKEYEYEGNNFLCSYIEKEEIAITIESLQLAGIDSIEDASGIGLADLILLFGDPDNTNSTLVDNIGKSAILSKIFGQVLISEKFTIGINQYCYYQAIGYFAYHDPFHYQTKVVKELDGVTDVDTLSQSDVKEIVSNFYRLIP